MHWRKGTSIPWAGLRKAQLVDQLPDQPQPTPAKAHQRLCLSSGGWLVSALVGQDAPVDDVGQAPLQGSAGLGWGLALAQLAQVIAAPGSRLAGLADRDGVQGSVELAVAAGVEPVALLVAAGGIQGAVGV
jgi:hypothetical protein